MEVARERISGGIESTRTHMTKWTMAAPAKPKSILTVRTIDTSTPEFQLGVALTLAPVRGSLPVSVLKLYPPEQPPDKVFRVFVVACRWVAGRCNQAVFEARVLSRDYSTDKTRMTYSLKLEERFDPEALTGAAVLNEDGYAMAVLDGRSSAAGSDGAYYDAEDLRMVVKR